nr:MAG TPA: hypothetical protein [Bacteriophage sp.]
MKTFFLKSDTIFWLLVLALSVMFALHRPLWARVIVVALAIAQLVQVVAVAWQMLHKEV